MSHWMEGCRQLTGPVPLRQGETYCIWCSGYGGQPIQFDPGFTQVNPARCHYCGGSGKALRK